MIWKSKLFCRDQELSALQQFVQENTTYLRIVGARGAGKSRFAQEALSRIQGCAGWWLTESGSALGETVLLSRFSLEEALTPAKLAYEEKKQSLSFRLRNIVKESTVDGVVGLGLGLLPGGGLPIVNELVTKGIKSSAASLWSKMSATLQVDAEPEDPIEVMLSEVDSWLEATDSAVLPSTFIAVVDGIELDMRSAEAIFRVGDLLRRRGVCFGCWHLNDRNVQLPDFPGMPSNWPTLTLGGLVDPTPMLKAAFPGITRAQIELFSETTANLPGAMVEAISRFEGRPRFFREDNLSNPLSLLAEQRLREVRNAVERWRLFAEDRFEEFPDETKQQLAFLANIGGRLPRFAINAMKDIFRPLLDDGVEANAWATWHRDAGSLGFSSELYLTVSNDYASSQSEQVKKLRQSLGYRIAARMNEEGIIECADSELEALQGIVMQGIVPLEAMPRIVAIICLAWLDKGMPKRVRDAGNAFTQLLRGQESMPHIAGEELEKIFFALRKSGAASAATRLLVLLNPASIEAPSPLLAKQIALIQVDQRNYDAALSILNTTLANSSLSPYHEAGVLLEMADVSTKSGALSHAEQYLGRAEKLIPNDPKDGTWLPILVRLQEEKADVLQAKGAFEESLKFLSDARVLLTKCNGGKTSQQLLHLLGKIGTLLAKTGQLEAAERNFEEALTLVHQPGEGPVGVQMWPSTAALSGKLADVLAKRGAVNEAIRLIETSLGDARALRFGFSWKSAILRGRLLSQLIVIAASSGGLENAKKGEAIRQLAQLLRNAGDFGQLPTSESGMLSLLRATSEAVASLHKSGDRLGLRSLLRSALAVFPDTDDTQANRYKAWFLHLQAEALENDGQIVQAAELRGLELALWRKLLDRGAAEPGELATCIERVCSAIPFSQRDILIREAENLLAETNYEPVQLAGHFGRLARLAGDAGFALTAFRLSEKELAQIQNTSEKRGEYLTLKRLTMLAKPAGEVWKGLFYGKAALHQSGASSVRSNNGEANASLGGIKAPDRKLLTQLALLAKETGDTEIQRLCEEHLATSRSENYKYYIALVTPIVESIHLLRPQPMMIFDLDMAGKRLQKAIEECARTLVANPSLAPLFVLGMTDAAASEVSAKKGAASTQKSELMRLATVRVINEARKIQPGFRIPNKVASETKVNIPFWGRTRRLSYLDAWLSRTIDIHMQPARCVAMAENAATLLLSLPPSAQQAAQQLCLRERLIERVESLEKIIDSKYAELHLRLGQVRLSIVGA